MHNRQFFLNVGLGLLLILANGFVLASEKRPLAFLLSAVLPYVFMIAIATDTGRWVKFAVGNTGLLALTLDREQALAAFPRGRVFLGYALILVLLVLGPTHVNVVNNAAVALMDKLHLPDPKLNIEGLEQCDPDWRSVVTSP